MVPTLDAADDELFSNVRLVHAYNPGAFNKSWGLNVATRFARTPWLIFADADLMLPAGLDETLDLVARGIEVVKPYNRLLDLSENETRDLDHGVMPNAIIDPHAGGSGRKHLGEHIVLAGGIFAIQSGTYARLGGFDERFLGWGGEDNAMTLKIQRARPSVVQLDAAALHLFHPRDTDKLQSSPHYPSNLRLLETYRDFPENVLFRQFEIQRQSAGNLQKYAPQRLIET